jgi:raffinose/stachyose/melibiose transport system substrate-binding protein
MKNSRALRRALVTVAAVSAAAMTMTGCSGSSGGSSASSGGKVTLTWWHNVTSGQYLKDWTQTAADFHKANPNITIKSVPIQNEQFTTKVPLALQGKNPPDIYFNQGGGLLATQSQSGRVADITSETKDLAKTVGAAAQGWAVQGKQMGMPYDSHVVGFWYRTDLFKKAGIAAPPTTMDELNADVAKLKKAGITPISVGGKDRWPDAFYYNYFSVRECSVAALKKAASSAKFNDACFTKAGQDVLDFLKAKPFQQGFNGTAAQQGSGSSAGLVANGKAAMELQGDWDLPVMTGLNTDKSLESKLDWFPFPAVSGAAGDPKAALGGGDGFACTTAHAADCAKFLQYLASGKVQKTLVKNGDAAIPVNAAAASEIKSPVVKKVFDFNHAASYVQVYWDIALPTAAGQALDDAAANLFAGKGSADSVAKAVNSAG